jgi:hypothetical protein
MLGRLKNNVCERMGKKRQRHNLEYTIWAFVEGTEENQETPQSQ